MSNSGAQRAPGQLQPPQRSHAQGAAFPQQTPQRYPINMAQGGPSINHSPEGPGRSPTDYNSRLAPSYSWHGGPEEYQQHPQQSQHLFPVAGYDGFVNTGQGLRPAQPPQPNVRADQYVSNELGGPFTQRLEMSYPGQQQVPGWNAGESLSPSAARDERMSDSSRPGTAEPPIPAPTIVKQEANDAADEEQKVDHRKRKRNRTIRSCVPCHNHKRKVSLTPRGITDISVIGGVHVVVVRH